MISSQLLAEMANRLTRESIENPLLYTRARDVHDLGIGFIQMLMGLDVTTRFPNPEAALGAGKLSATHLFPRPNRQYELGSFSTPLRTILKDMLTASKKNTPSCISLLGRLTDIAPRLSTPRLLTPSTGIKRTFLLIHSTTHGVECREYQDAHDPILP